MQLDSLHCIISPRIWNAWPIFLNGWSSVGLLVTSSKHIAANYSMGERASKSASPTPFEPHGHGLCALILHTSLYASVEPHLCTRASSVSQPPTPILRPPRPSACRLPVSDHPTI